jgi:Leucine-rich repeat (LRR) protein
MTNQFCFQVEDDAFEGLQSLEYLDMSDNKVLSLPAGALGRLPNLKRLKADYNRIGALSYDILRSVQGLEELSLAYNIIREIPEGTFK